MEFHYRHSFLITTPSASSPFARSVTSPFFNHLDRKSSGIVYSIFPSAMLPQTQNFLLWHIIQSVSNIKASILTGVTIIIYIHPFFSPSVQFQTHFDYSTTQYHFNHANYKILHAPPQLRSKQRKWYRLHTQLPAFRRPAQRELASNHSEYVPIFRSR